MVYWALRGFECLRWVVRWRGEMTVRWVVVVVVGASASALGDRQKGLCGSSLIRVTSMHEIKSNRPYV